MVKKEAVELSEYELQRQANIAERDALLKQLAQDAASAGLGPKPISKPTTNGTRALKKKTTVKKIKEEVVPRRTFSRLAGITADSEVAKRKAEDQYEATKEVERAKKQRVSADLSLGDIVVAGKEWDKSENFFVDDIGKRGADPYERMFGETEVRKTTDKKLRTSKEKISSLEITEIAERRHPRI